MSGGQFQPEPPRRAGAGWLVFEHLVEWDIADPTAVENMTPEQRMVFAFNVLRQEVNSGGFDSYFRYTGGNTARYAAYAADAAQRIGDGRVQLINDACSVLGSPYPVDIDERERLVERLINDYPDVFTRLDDRLYELEVQQPADEKIDAFIWAHKADFFR